MADLNLAPEDAEAFMAGAGVLFLTAPRFLIGLFSREPSVLALGASLARFELTLLDELGFGLDLSSCAATGSTATGAPSASKASARTRPCAALGRSCSAAPRRPCSASGPPRT